MILNISVDDQNHPFEVPEEVLAKGNDFFNRIDQDMDAGWKMGRQWVAQPNLTQRCQIAADRLLTAMEKNNQRLAWMMAGYILSRMPDITLITIDTQGEMEQTRIERRLSSPPNSY